MSKIITITFNPALDKSITVRELIPERKLKCSVPVYEPGGGGINVSRAIKKLGGESVAVYLAGGFAGEEITRLLAEEHIKTTALDIHNLTRENLIVTDLGNHKQYLFDLPGPQVDEHEWKACLQVIEYTTNVEFLVVSGSLSPGVSPDIFKHLALMARQKNAKLIVDTSGAALAAALNAGVYLIKPNLKEMGLLAEKKEINEVLATDFAKELIRDGKCEVVVLSLGGSGAVLVNKEIVVHIHPPEVEIKSTVGAGDSLLAGIVLSLENKKSLEEAVKYGVACGTAATMNPGTELCTKKQADHLYQVMSSKATVHHH
jgi:6-phosphofructokinase 2